MTKQEMEAMEAELKTRFPGLEIKTHLSVEPNYATQTFVEKGQISIWAMNECVCVLSKLVQLEALITVARLLSQEQSDDTHYGECVYCNRMGILNRFSSCEGCVLAAQVDN